MSITVSDPFGAVSDSQLPMLALALDPVAAKSEFKRRLPRLSGEGRLQLKAIRVIRHKPGRRCVVEYDVEVKQPDAPQHVVTLIGKIRARRSGNEGFRQLEAVWNAGFQSDSADGISVPEQIGVISRFQMWFQRKIEGETATRLLTEQDGVRLAVRIAEAIHKLHRANVPTERAHTMTDELRILRECLTKVAGQKPEWSARIGRLMHASERLGATVPEPKASGIHRDFYPAQVIVDASRLYLIDFDLYCQGDPGLDVGNFIGHMTEQSLRERGHAEALAEQERALEERFVELAGNASRTAIRVYTTLTLVRHVFLSTQFPERQQSTEKLLQLCEQRLGLA